MWGYNCAARTTVFVYGWDVCLWEVSVMQIYNDPIFDKIDDFCHMHVNYYK